MKLGVTGATGELGRRVIDELSALTSPEQVVGFARDPGKAMRTDIELRAADYTDAGVWAKALSDIDTLLIVSSPAGPWDRVQMHRNVIAGAQAAGVRKALYSSVIGNGLEADTLYAPVAAVNRQAEQDLAGAGLAWIVPRNGLYLEFDVAHIVNAASEGGVFRNNGGTGRCAYITRDELAFATARLMLDDTHNGKILNLVGECHTQAELIDMVNDVYGLTVSFEPISDAACFAKLEPVRGEIVANMLTGCYQCIRSGAFDVSSDFAAAAGRPAKPVRQQIEELQAANG